MASKKQATRKAPAKKAVKKTPARKKAPRKGAAKKPAKKTAAAKKAAVGKVTAKKAAAKKKGAVKKLRKPTRAQKAQRDDIGVLIATELPAGLKLTPFVASQRQRLLDLRDELISAMDGVTRETLRNAPEGSEASGSGMHQADAGSDAYDRDFALSVLAKEQDALFEIEEALKRIQRGAYGVCEISGKKIPRARLEAIPFARLTVECQAAWEKEHGTRRFRPSEEIGFGGMRVLEPGESPVSLDDPEK